MLWVFTIIGLVTSGSILFRLVIAVRIRHRSWMVEAAALAPLAVAWGAQHTSPIGWIALLTAFGIELLRWVTAPSPDSSAGIATTTTDQDDVPSDLAAPPDPRQPGAHQPITDGPTSDEQIEDVLPTAAVGDESHEHAATPARTDSPVAGVDRTDRRFEPAKPEQPAAHDGTTGVGSMTFTTYALLNAPWEATPTVFFASLRRAGRRDAQLMTKGCSGELRTRVRVRAGDVELELVGAATRVPKDELDFAISQLSAPSEAVDISDRHVAHVRFHTECPADTPCRDVVHLHLCAHAALAEFTPVPAVLWPAAGRLVPAADLDKPDDSETSLVTMCVRFRVSHADESAAGYFVSDTVGLHAFGLPDVQVITDGEPGEAVASVVRDLAGGVFNEGCDVQNGRILSPIIDDIWESSLESASFPPQRNVIQLRRKTEDMSEKPPTGSGLQR